jgi:hypothetical protein
VPKQLILVQPGRRTVVPITEPSEWDGQACARCGRRIEHDPAVFLTDDEVRCARCVTKPSFDACLWCGNPGSRRDSGPPLGDHAQGEVFCQPCWAIYVAYIGEMVDDPGPFQDLVAEVKAIIREEGGGA